jgi:hypothetical protein
MVLKKWPSLIHEVYLTDWRQGGTEPVSDGF